MKQIKIIIASLLVMLIFNACIKDDFVDDMVDPVLRITTIVDTLEINTSFQFEHQYLNNIGQEEEANVIWSSSDPAIVEVSSDGLATAIQEGSATLTVQYDNNGAVLEDEIIVNVGATTVIITTQSVMGSIATTSSYALTGDFEFKETDNGVELIFADNYAASTALPGLYVYLSNNRNSVANAYEISAVEVFNGAHTYDLDGIGFTDYQYVVYFCKPFNVKVGDGEF